MSIRDLVPRKRDLPAQQDRERDPFVTWREEMDRMFDAFWDRGKLAPWTRGGLDFHPQVDVIETDEEVRVEADLPGLEAQDVDLSVSRNVLSIRGEKKHEREERGETFFRSERAYGAFERSIPLPQGIDREQADATFENGVLTITFPKLAAAEDKKKITVKTE
jgi:HSP20 family protein